MIKSWVRKGIWLLPLYGVFTLYATWTHQPDVENRFGAWSEYVTTANFLISHLIGSIFGTTIGILGVISLGLFLADSRRSRSALLGTVAVVLGSGGVLALFGIAASTQPALGDAYLGGLAEARDLYQAVYGPSTLGLALTSIVLFSLGSILLGTAIFGSGTLPKWTGVAYALSGPLIGIVGLVVGQAQTVGSVLVVLAGFVIARRIGLAWASRGGSNGKG